LEDRTLLTAVRLLPGFEANVLSANDDNSMGPIPFGFEVDFFGDRYTSLYVNNNGNVTFTAPLNDWTPEQLEELGEAIIAPFWGDVDTRGTGSGEATFGTDMVEGRLAFGVNWIDVGYFSQHDTPLNSFQLVLIDRSDVESGAFDIEFNYDTINWETGDADGGIDGLGGVAARAGFSKGTMESGTFYELIGSGLNSSFVDVNALTGLVNSSLRSGQPGRYLFEVRQGSPLDGAGLAGQFVDLGNGIYFLGESSLSFEEDAIDNAVDLSNADRVFASGGLGLNLDGTGVTIAQWESGVPRINHVELTGTVTLGNTPAAGCAVNTKNCFTDHATMVAGTIAAKGTAGGVAGSPIDRGMAPGVTIRSFDTDDFEKEFTANTPNFALSNRSNSIPAGWKGTQDFDALAVLEPTNSAAKAADVWLGARDEGTEDANFGKYTAAAMFLDDTIFKNPAHLSIWAAGNDRNDQFSDKRKNNRYVAYFKAAPAGSLADLGEGMYYVSATKFPLPDKDGTGAKDGDGFDSIPEQLTAKNILAVGAIDDAPFVDGSTGGLIEPGDPGFQTALDSSFADFTSWGPTDDGRIKPDVVANGVDLNMPIARNVDGVNGFDDFDKNDGTSFAAPAVTGIAALLTQHYNNLKVAGGNPSAATLKSLLIHTAIDGFNPGPDYKSGWGLVDAAAAAEQITEFTTSTPTEVDLLRADQVFNPAVPDATVYQVKLDAGQQLKATLVWTDPPGPAQARHAEIDKKTSALVNDLDLFVESPNKTIFRPFVLDPTKPDKDATQGINDRDNVEQVVMTAPTSGLYSITVGGAVAVGGTQSFSLIATSTGPRTVITADDDAPNSHSDDGLADKFRIVKNGANIEVYVNGNLAFSEPENSMVGFTIRGSSDNDTLTVDVSGGVIPLRDKIRFEGRGGFDTLNVNDSGSPQTPFTDEAINIGSHPGDGTHTLDGQTIEFTGLEPINTNVLATNFTIGSQPGLASLLQDANQINYTAGQTNGPTWGRVTVDNFEPMEFSNKGKLLLDAGAGGDVVHLNNPQKPAGLFGIEVSGQDPTGSDRLIVNSTPDFADDLSVDFTATGAGEVHNLMIPAPTWVNIKFSGIEHLQVVGQTTDADAVRISSTASDDTVEYTPGPTVDSGLLTGFASGASPFAFVPIDFRGILGAVIPMSGSGAVGKDTLILNGTAADDVMRVSYVIPGVLSGPEVRVELNSRPPVIVDLGGIDDDKSVVLRGLAGNDTFNVDFDPVNYAAILTVIRVEGGNSDGSSDVLNHTSEPGVATTIDLASSTISTVTELPGGPLSTQVVFTGVERVNHTSSGAASTLTVTGTPNDDTLNVLPTAAGAGEFSRVTSGPLFTYSGVGSAFTFHGGAGYDALHILGNDGPDVVTSTATSVTRAGGTVTLGSGLERFALSTLGGDDSIDLNVNIPGPLDILVDAGNGNDSINLENSKSATILGGDGNDIIVGSPGEDRIYGGAGSDLIQGVGGSDFIFGEEGSDSFVWNVGDGADIVEGGAGENDGILFIGSDADETFSASLDGGLLVVTVGGVLTQIVDAEDLALLPGNGQDSVSISGDAATELRRIYVNLFGGGGLGGGDGAADSVGILGTRSPDAFGISDLGGFVNVVGLEAVVRIFGSNADEGDRLTVHGQEGDDHIKAEPGVEAKIGLTLNGGPGDDYLSADAILIGGTGDDFLEGGAGADTLLGFDGDDVMIGHGGIDAFDGGAGFDTILIQGTSGNDSIFVDQTAADLLSHRVNADSQIGETIAGVEEVRVEAGRGDDAIAVRVKHGLDFASLRFDVRGDASNASDRLAVVDDGIGNLTIVREAPDGRSGSVTVGALNPVFYKGIENVDLTPLDPFTNGTGSDGLGRVLVFDADPFEFNDIRPDGSIHAATPIELVQASTVLPTIDPGALTMLDPAGVGVNVRGDADWYLFRAPKTGTFRFDVFFEMIPTLANGEPGLPANGDLDIGVFDQAGNLIVQGTPVTGGEEAVFSASADTEYYLRVTGATFNAFFSAAINAYAVRVEEVDLLGPQVFDPDGFGGVGAVHITHDDPTTPADERRFDLFNPKPSAGPTPLVRSLTVHFRDLLTRDLLGRAPGNLADLYPALDALVAGQDGRYQLRGDHNGVVPIAAITVTNDSTMPQDGTVVAAALFPDGVFGNAELSDQDDFYNGQFLKFNGGVLSGQTRVITDYLGATRLFVFDNAFGALPAVGDPFSVLPVATAHVELHLSQPLPDDRYTLTVLDTLRDPAANRADAESNASEPQDEPSFPTGDGLAGGDFVARFTVDSRPEVGVYHSGSVWVDTNGNATFDPQNADFVNRDITYMLGFTTDNLFAGNFGSLYVPGNTADGFDKLAAYGRVGSHFRWLIDMDNDGVPNPPTGIIDPAGINGIPVAGNFDGKTHNGDEVGLLAGNTWWFDTDHDYLVDASVTLGLSGLPIVGDFDGDGHDDLGAWQDDRFTFLLTGGADKAWLTGGALPASIGFGFIGTRERPVAADMDRDGIDDIGLWAPDRAGVAPAEQGEWYFLVSNDPLGIERVPGTVVRLDHPFKPVPFGADLAVAFGDEFAVPVLGNLDPPVAPTPAAPVSFGATNIDDACDVNGDGGVTALDVLTLVNQINASGTIPVTAGPLSGPYLDVNEDGLLTAADVLFVINRINSETSSVIVGEGENGAGASRADGAREHVGGEDFRVSPPRLALAENTVRVDGANGSPALPTPGGALVVGISAFAADVALSEIAAERRLTDDPAVALDEDDLSDLAARLHGPYAAQSVDELFAEWSA
jgi:hypothetical protein